YHDFTCCVGTGMENHALHGYGIYYETAATLYVNIFAPSTARVPGLGVDVAMDTSFPDGGDATVALTMPEPKTFTLAIRRPSWAGDGFRVKVNGQDVPQPALASLQPGRAGGRLVSQDPRVPPPSTFVELTRAWKSGDRVELTLPRSLRFEFTPDDAKITAIMWGPLALAADHGPRLEGRAAFTERTPVPAIVAAGRPLDDWMQPAAQPGNFTARQVARVAEQPAPPTDLDLKPFYRTYERNYSLYFDLWTPADFDARVAGLAADADRQRALEAATVSFVRPGNRQDDATFRYTSAPADRPVERTDGRTGRGGGGWFSYDLAVDPAAGMALVVTYYNDPGLTPSAGDFRILVDGAAVASFAPNADAKGFYDARYAMAADATRGKQHVTVKFDGGAHGRIAPVFGVRMVTVSGG
ncbi:MAG: DUF6805 domain-containing protein, partial [Gemmatimonadaceae bacterium]